MKMAVAADAEMETRHTALRLYQPIQELSFVSAYFPSSGRARGSCRVAGLASLLARPTAGNDCDWKRDAHLAEGEQRAQSYKSPVELLSSCETTKAAVAELRWLAAEHHQLLADLLALCGDCAIRLRMGNQDGKLQENPQGATVPGQTGVGDQAVGTSGPQHPPSPERKKGVLKSKKLKKLGGKKIDSAEEFLQSKLKKKVENATGLDVSGNSGKQAGKASNSLGSPGSQASLRCPDTPETGSYASACSEPILPMDDDFHIAREGWDFMEDSQAFMSGGDLCSELSEYNSQLYLGCGPIASSSFLEDTQGPRQRLDSGNNLRCWTGKSSSSALEQCASSDRAVTNSAIGLHDHTNRKETGVKSATKTQHDAKADPEVDHVRTDRLTTLSSGAVEAASHPSRDSSVAGQGNSPQVGPDMMGQKGCPGADRPMEGLRLPLSSPSTAGKSQARSPSSPSLSGVFNTSYPASNSLQSMSPMLSPLSSRLPSPQLNHRILLLPEVEDCSQGHGPGSAGSRQLAYGAALSFPEDEDEPKVTTEVIDKNGNKRTITRLDLNLSRQGAGNSRWNISGNSPMCTTTGE